MENTDTATTVETVEEAKTYSQEEFDKALQSEVDKRITQAMKTAEKKKEAAVKEAQKLAAMNEQEKYEYELKSREEAIAAKEKALALAENKAEAAKILADKGISAQLVEFVVAEDAEAMLNNINLLDKEFKASVKAEVEKRLATSTPKKNLPLSQELNREGFKKMTLTQQAELFNTNPELYKQLSGR